MKCNRNQSLAIRRVCEHLCSLRAETSYYTYPGASFLHHSKSPPDFHASISARGACLSTPTFQQRCELLARSPAVDLSGAQHGERVRELTGLCVSEIPANRVVGGLVIGTSLFEKSFHVELLCEGGAPSSKFHHHAHNHLSQRTPIQSHQHAVTQHVEKTSNIPLERNHRGQRQSQLSKQQAIHNSIIETTIVLAMSH